MKIIIHSWVDSLRMFNPANLLLLLRITVKSTLTSYVMFAKFFWWLVILGMALDYVDWNISAAVIWFFSMFFLFLTIRPSVQKKTLGYYFGYVRSHGLKFFLVYALFMFLIVGVPILAHLKHLADIDSEMFEFFGDFLYWIWWPLHLIGLFPGFANPLTGNFLLISFIMPVFIFLMLFVLEDKNGVSGLFAAFRRAYTMVIDLLPVCAVVYIFFVVLVDVVQNYIVYPSLRYFEYVPSLSYSPWYIFMLLVPIPVNLISNIYLKQLHKDYKRYY